MSRRPHDTHDLTYWNLFRFCCRKGYIDIIKILLRRCIPYWDVCKYITINNINAALDDKRYKTVLFLISQLLYIDNNHVDKLFQEVYNYHSQQYKILKLLLCNVSTSTILECFDKSFNVSVYNMIAKYKPHLLNRSLKRRYQKYLKMKNI